MTADQTPMRIAILGGGPSALFMYKRLIESGRADLEIHIYERKDQLGAGMPYSPSGANTEHVTNVSDNEIPTIVTHISEWVLTAPREVLDRFDITPENFNEYQVLPRLFFGAYLSAQFDLLQQQARELGISTYIHLSTGVDDIAEDKATGAVYVQVAGGAQERFDSVIICTGHHWPVRHEGTIPGYYDSPYPPVKLQLGLNHPVAIRGASLTAIDALRTLARRNGHFDKDKNGKVTYHLSPDSPDFRLVMHSMRGLLPAIRFHLEDTHLSKDGLLTSADITQHMAGNGGFLSLDYLFEKDFKDTFRTRDPEFYERIRDMSMEEFVADMMSLREKLDAFQLFRAEYAEAERSIRRKESVYWKEKLAILSYAMNYPAKHFSAEDMIRLQKVLMPLISIVIAFVPQNSCRELLALHDAGVLDLISVGEDSHMETIPEGGIHYHYTTEAGEKKSAYYKTFVDSIGQPHLSYADFPFRSLLAGRAISPARIRFRSAETASALMDSGHKDIQRYGDDAYYLQVSGITINDDFQIIDDYGAANEKIYIMAVPYIGGYNPDYSGLDFCEAASAKIVKRLFSLQGVK